MHIATKLHRPRLEIRDLRLVLAIAAARSTSAAAPILHLSQPAVSRALLVIEEKLGTRLFDRTSEGLEPTLAGERLIQGAGPFLAQLVDLEGLIKAPQSEHVRLRVVCECYTAYRWLPTALARLRGNFSRIDVDLVVEHTGSPIAALLSGEVDVALITTSAVPRKLRSQPLFGDEIVFVLGHSHPLARQTSLTPADLRESVIITSSNTPPEEAEWFFKRVFGRTIPKLRFLHFPLTEAIVDAARAGMGIAILSEWMVSSYLGSNDLVLKRLASGPLVRPWRIAYRPEVSGPARRLAEALAGFAPRAYASRAVGE